MQLNSLDKNLYSREYADKLFIDFPSAIQTITYWPHVCSRINWRSQEVSYSEQYFHFCVPSGGLLRLSGDRYIQVCKDNHVLVWTDVSNYFFFKLDELELVKTSDDYFFLDSSQTIAVHRKSVRPPIFVGKRSKTQFSWLVEKDEPYYNDFQKALPFLPEEILFVVGWTLVRLLPHRNLRERISLEEQNKYVESMGLKSGFETGNLSEVARNPITQEIYLRGWHTPYFALDPITYETIGTF